MAYLIEECIPVEFIQVVCQYICICFRTASGIGDKFFEGHVRIVGRHEQFEFISIVIFPCQDSVAAPACVMQCSKDIILSCKLGEHSGIVFEDLTLVPDLKEVVLRIQREFIGDSYGNGSIKAFNLAFGPSCVSLCSYLLFLTDFMGSPQEPIALPS